MFGIKARIARELAIAKICNADSGHFGRKIRVHDLIRGSFNACPDQLDPCLQALWYDATGAWNTAHEIVQLLDNATAARIHAYLHRKQGDDWNSRYWHRQAGTSYPDNMNLEQEWKSLVIMFVD